MSSESIPSTSKHGVSVPWAIIVKVVAWAIPVIASLLMMYLSSVFVTQGQIEPLTSLPSRVERLEEFKVEQKVQQAGTTAAIGTIQQDLAGVKAEIRALKEESTRNTDRILERLNRMDGSK